ncbi:MAG: hypothetical protein LC099_06850 [Anaerolineales bacterium]|nr:hypothetical protein [Anaerolineales bacterium]
MFDIKSSSNQSSSSEDKAPNIHWLNIGITVPINGVDKFVSLPLGIPLNSIQVKDYKGNNSEYAEFVAVQKQLVSAILEQSATIPPGESRKLESKQLQLELRHAAPASEPVVRPDITLNFKLK